MGLKNLKIPEVSNKPKIFALKAKCDRTKDSVTRFRKTIFQDLFRSFLDFTRGSDLFLFFIFILLHDLDAGEPDQCGPQGADPLPPLLRVAKAGRNHLNKEITPLLPTGIGERYSQTSCSAFAPM
jgi:hypothetical protein